MTPRERGDVKYIIGISLLLVIALLIYLWIQQWSRDQLEASYQSDWIARKAIQIPAQDATREWRAWQAEQDQIELIEATEERLHVQLRLQEALVKARLYGGCCILIGVDGDMSQELDPTKIMKDGLKFLHVLAPHQLVVQELIKGVDGDMSQELDPTKIMKDGLKFLHVLAPHQLVVQELIKDISSPYYGQPEYYTLTDDSGKYGSVNIHPSRMVRLIGLDPPDAMFSYGWGDPVMQMINDAVSAAGTVMGSVAAMISEAKFDVIKIPGLTEIFATTDGTERLVKRFTEANVAKSVINAVVLDGEEEWQRIAVSFRGMPEILQMYLQIAAGAADIPVTRFLGMSPAGMNATGESDLTNYYDRIHSDQELRLTPALEKLDIAIQQSSLGTYDENIFYEWNSLWQLDEGQKAAIALQKAQATTQDIAGGLIPFDALVKGKCNQLIEDGTYPGLEAALEESIANQDLQNENELALSMHEEKQQSKQLAMEAQKQKLLGPPDKAKDQQKDSNNALLWRMYDLLVQFDPLKHERASSGSEHGGEFVAMGEQLSKTTGFVSPSVKSNLDFKGAQRELNSRQQVRLRQASDDINDKVGLRDTHDVNIIGAWSDGAENSG